MANNEIETITVNMYGERISPKKDNTEAKNTKGQAKKPRPRYVRRSAAEALYCKGFGGGAGGAFDGRAHECP